MRLIDVDVYCATICRCNRRACDRGKCPIHNAPTAYDIEKVVEQLKKEFKKYYGENWDKAPYLVKAIEIVNHGCVNNKDFSEV